MVCKGIAASGFASGVDAGYAVSGGAPVLVGAMITDADEV
jgi:hypothetical protein